MKKITIRDVAAAAGVSVSTVSQVFNNYPRISKTTREKVLAISQKLEYAPSMVAKSLSSKRKRIIALILNEITVTPGVAMPLEILAGVSEALDKRNYDFVFYATNRRKQKEKSLVQFFNEYNLAGLLIQGLSAEEPYYEELKTCDLPIVAIDLDIDNMQVGTLSVDNTAASKEVTQRLQAAGYKTIVFVNGNKNATVSQKREDGFLAAGGRPELIFYANFSEKEAYEWAMHYTNWQEVDAVFTASDLMAIGIIKALKALPLNRKIAIVGFDDIALASYITPSLTTVRQNVAKMAERATENLICQIETKQVRHDLLPYEIIVRESALIA